MHPYNTQNEKSFIYTLYLKGSILKSLPTLTPPRLRTISDIRNRTPKHRKTRIIALKRPQTVHFRTIFSHFLRKHYLNLKILYTFAIIYQIYLKFPFKNRNFSGLHCGLNLSLSILTKKQHHEKVSQDPFFGLQWPRR